MESREPRSVPCEYHNRDASVVSNSGDPLGIPPGFAGSGRLMRAILIMIVGLLSIGIPIGSAHATSHSEGKDETAVYSVQFTATWSAETHPHSDGAFPTASAHFSPLIGAVHGADVQFWAMDELASLGIEQMAETGATGQLRSEIAAAIDDGRALSVISGGGPASPGSTEIAQVQLDRAFPMMTLVTMIAPSPDWFVGISGETLLDSSGNWVATRHFVLYPYDAGTDSGADYQSPNADTVPPESIHSLRASAPFSDAPIGTFTVTRIDSLQAAAYLPLTQR